MDLVSGSPTDAQSLSDAETIAAPGWNRFISNEQVLRRGTAISATVTFDHEAASAVARCLHGMEHDFEREVGELLTSEFAAEGVRTISSAAVSDAERVIVTLPSMAFVVGGRSYEMGATATVCQGDTNSKVWVRVTHFEDEPATSERLASQLSGLAIGIYSKCARTVRPTIEFEERFAFHIKAAYSSDEAITDAFNILLRSPDPQAAFDDLRERQKLSPIARLIDFAQGGDPFALNEEALKDLWLERNERGPERVSSITPWTFRQGEAIVLIEASQEPPSVRAWGLCHTDALDIDASPPVREAAVHLSGKLASALAHNL